MDEEKIQEELTEEKLENYEEKFSDEGLWNKVTGQVKSIGVGVIYKALQLYYATENPACPPKVKYAVLAVLGYLISPLDGIPDFTPFVGYADDASAIGVALVWAQMYIDDEVKKG